MRAGPKPICLETGENSLGNAEHIARGPRAYPRFGTALNLLGTLKMRGAPKRWRRLQPGPRDQSALPATQPNGNPNISGSANRGVAAKRIAPVPTFCPQFAHQNG